MSRRKVTQARVWAGTPDWFDGEWPVDQEGRGPAMQTHLSARAVELVLRGHRPMYGDKQGVLLMPRLPSMSPSTDLYFFKTDVAFCGSFATNYVTAQVMRAIFDNRDVVQVGGFVRRTYLPTCPICAMALDQLLVFRADLIKEAKHFHNPEHFK